MKKLLYVLPLMALFFLTSHKVTASHMAGGEIWYEFTGDANNPYKYRIWLQFYRDVSGIGAPMNEEISIKSGCFPDRCVNLTFSPFALQNPCPSPTNNPNNDTCYGSVPGSILTPNLQECVNPSSGGTFVQTEIYRFYADVVLDGTCSDWTFGFNENARNANSNLSGGGTFYIESTLNNILGPNSGPVFVNPAAKSFCVGSPFVWSQAAIEPDGDSLYFDFGIPQTSADACPTTPSPMGFNAGYTKRQPMQTANGINIDHKNGTFTFTPSNTEVDVINVTVTEYRYDPNTTFWLLVGTSVRDLQVPVMGQCKSEVSGGPKLNLSASGFTSQQVDKDSTINYLKGLGLSRVNIDSSELGSSGLYRYSMGVIEYDCFSNVIPITFNIDILCESIDTNGLDFRVIGSDSIPRPVTGVNFTCKPDLTTRSIELELHKPLDENGSYYLQVKKGNDGNTITNRCGFELQDYYTMIIQVNNCPILDYRLENVSVEGDTAIRVDWYADSTSFSEDLFTEWQILRSNNGSNFYPLDTVNNVKARSYIDDGIDYATLDEMNFSYAVQLRQNFDFKAPTNTISSILLSDSIHTEESIIDYSWTEYNGWTNEDTIKADREYEFFIAKFDSTSMSVPANGWTSYEGPDENLFSTTYTKPSKEVCLNTDTAGMYVAKVVATPVGNPLNTYESESNWLYFSIKCTETPDPEEPQEPLVPNVFTPNGDMQNDRFYVNQVDAYMGSGDQFGVSIFNRWGKMVFEDTDFRAENNQNDGWDGTDMNSGSKVADGVYYYIINLQDSETGKTEELTGQVNVFTLIR